MKEYCNDIKEIYSNMPAYSKENIPALVKLQKAYDIIVGKLVAENGNLQFRYVPASKDIGQLIVIVEEEEDVKKQERWFNKATGDLITEMQSLLIEIRCGG